MKRHKDTRNHIRRMRYLRKSVTKLKLLLNSVHSIFYNFISSLGLCFSFFTESIYSSTLEEETETLLHQLH